MQTIVTWWGSLLRALRVLLPLRLSGDSGKTAHRSKARQIADQHLRGNEAADRSASPKLTPMPATPVFGARRPLINRAGALAGFEFRLPTAVANRLALAQDSAANAAHITALFASMRPTIAAGRTAVIALPISILSRPTVLEAVPAGVMLAITDADQPAMQSVRAHETLTALNRAGAKLGGVGQPLSGCEFVVLNADQANVAGLLENVAAIRALWGDVKVITTGVRSIGDLEQLLRSGVDFAAGIVDQTTTVHERTPMSPRLQQICRLIHHVVSDEDFSGVTQVLRREVELSYQLLRYTNAAGFGNARPLESVDHAATILGRDGLYQWLTTLLLTSGSGRATSRALREIALARARLLELLSGYSGAPASGMFTLGLLSLLDVMLQLPMDGVIEQLPLALPLREALIDKTGAWRPALELVQALESGDLATAADLAWPYGGLQIVMEESDAAWRWAAEAVRTKA
jgi:EAL and modified HD-GYP domain-containing signal transduction protein